MSACFASIFSLLSQLFVVPMPWGISFGVTIMGAATFPILLWIIKRIF